MSSDSDKRIFNRLEDRWLEDPDFQRRGRAIAYHLVRRYQLSTVTAEDLYQTVMERLLHYSWGKRSNEIKNPHAFLYRVALNTVRSIFSQEKSHPNIPFEDVPSKDFSDRLEEVKHIESRLLLREMRERLNDEERHLLDLWLNGYTLRQLATMMNTSHVTVANRVSSLIEKIKESIFGASDPGQARKK